MACYASTAQEELHLAHSLAGKARNLSSSGDLDPLLDRIGDARVVCIGEASHGTSEYYRWRALLTERLIEEKGFAFVAVEGDWAECRAAHRYASGQEGSQAAAVLTAACTRWPAWMWANHEVAEFLEWLRTYNSTTTRDRMVGFYGIDVYGMWDSLRQLDAHAVRSGDATFRSLLDGVSNCFRAYDQDAQSYGFAATHGLHSCAAKAEILYQHLRLQELVSEDAFVAAQHALVVRNAERYYRSLYMSDAESWNIRDTHMADMLDRLLRHHGPYTKATVWQHNTHVGNARYTDMAWAGEVNIGQLARQRYGRANVALVGMGGYEGSVVAAEAWGRPMRHMIVPQAREKSWEHAMHVSGAGQSLFLSRDVLAYPEAMEPRGHRAIGVVYNPNFEVGNYVPTVLPLRYDAFLFFPMTRALHPLHAFMGEEGELPQLYPTGV